MKFISWNVNGFRAVLKKGFEEIFNELDADFSVFKKPRCRKVKLTSPRGLLRILQLCGEKGLLRTAVFAKKEPLCRVRNHGA